MRLTAHHSSIALQPHMRWVVTLLLACFVLWSTIAAAEPSTDELRTAETAIAEQRYEDALAALERAYLAERDAYYLYRRILVLERMGERDLALAVLEENRDALVDHERITDLAVVEERLRQPDVATRETTTPRRGGPSIPLLVAGGVAFVGGTVLSIVGIGQVFALDCQDGTCFHERDGVLAEDEYESRRLRGNVLAFGGAGLAVAGATTVLLAFVLRPGERAATSLLITPRSLELRFTF